MVIQNLPATPQETWQRIRANDWRGVTSGVAPGHVQANLAILPRDWPLISCCSASATRVPARCWR